jgi:hypothetical protein
MGGYLLPTGIGRTRIRTDFAWHKVGRVISEFFPERTLETPKDAHQLRIEFLISRLQCRTRVARSATAGRELSD